MKLNQLARKFENNRLNQSKGAFAQLCIVQNLLQTIFDKSYGVITLKQFMLMIMVKQSSEFNEELTLTEYGKLLGCSRQNVKKLAVQLESKNFVVLKKSKHDPRALAIVAKNELLDYFKEIDEINNNQLLKLFSVLSDSELTELYKTLEKLHEGIAILDEE
ncbi:MarR family winged helix-turn-helix transcriptional regulator [Anaerorhabdus sp.]|jgi:MarR family transcriptional regulator, negative regulator of the multidrug operon emrRAB|uniref:MarR family winged helix-turn-helix transcriptional regulator n=1 Tax=Anaerorhabdus sp. TaxID=1872524 RepID=UPI002FCC668E